jgi:hypothetical protein
MRIEHRADPVEYGVEVRNVVQRGAGHHRVQRFGHVDVLELGPHVIRSVGSFRVDPDGDVAEQSHPWDETAEWSAAELDDTGR